MPIRADTRWPPKQRPGLRQRTVRHGEQHHRRRGPSTAPASGETVAPRAHRLAKYTAKMATKPPSADTRRSRWLTGLNSMPSSFSQDDGFLGCSCLLLQGAVPCRAPVRRIVTRTRSATHDSRQTAGELATIAASSFLPGPGEIMNPLSQLPSVDRLLSAAALASLIDLHGRAVVTGVVREVLAATREAVKDGAPLPERGGADRKSRRWRDGENARRSCARCSTSPAPCCTPTSAARRCPRGRRRRCCGARSALRAGVRHRLRRPRRSR
jgi:hypothetical protein